MFHCHVRGPASVLINTKNSFEEVDKGIHWVNFTFRYLGLKISRINLPSFTLSLFILHHWLLLNEFNLQVIKGTKLNVLLRYFKSDSSWILKLLECLKSKLLCLLTKVEVLVSISTFLNQMLGWKPKKFNDSWKLVILWITRKDWDTKEELCTDTSKWPHINSWIIWQPKEYFWTSIVSGLNVLKNGESFKASTS